MYRYARKVAERAFVVNDYYCPKLNCILSDGGVVGDWISPLQL